MNSETAEFLALFKTLAGVNLLLLSYVDEVAASIQALGPQPLVDEITSRAESIRDRMSLIANLAAELKGASD